MKIQRVLQSTMAIVLCFAMVVAPISVTAQGLNPKQPNLRQDGESLVDMPVSSAAIAVGSRDFTEQLILGQLIVVALEDAGFEVVDNTGLGGTNSAHDAVKNGEVDIIWDYIGTILSESHGVPPVGLPTDLDTAFQMVSALDERHHELQWLTPTPFNDTYTLMVDPAALALKTNETINTIDELAFYVNGNKDELTICVENEFYARGDGLYAMQEHYDFAFPEEQIQIVAYDQLYEGLRAGLCDVAEGFSTDGRISAWNFQNLEDSSGFFPAYNASPIIRAELLEAQPEIGDILNRISATLDNQTIAALNAQVDIGPDGERGSGDEEAIRDVVVQFLQENELIGQPEVERPVIAVGSRDFTEQLVLGQIIVVLLEDAGFDVVDKTGLGGTNSAHDALKAGEVDIIWDYIGTILSESHGIPAVGLPADTNTALEMVRGLDNHHHDLVWLSPTAFNDTYTMMVNPEALEEKIGTSLASISELADYMNENDSPLSICVENEFYARGDGLYAMQEHYGFSFQEEMIQIVAYDQLYEGLRAGLCDVAEGFSTDGRISAWAFQNLEDSDLFFPAYNASPIIRDEVLEAYPAIGELLETVSPILDNETIAALNARVDIGADGERNSGDEELVRDVAQSFLQQNRLLSPPEITVGSRDFTEQLLLGQILIGALESTGFRAIDKTGLGGTNSAHDALKVGEVDIIWDYIGTILSESHGVPPIGLPSDTETALKMVRGLDAHHHDLIWLKPTTFNDTYTLMVEPEALEEKLGQSLESIEDLASYMNEVDSSLTICVENEFYTRGDGLYSLQEHYDFKFDEENIEIVAYDQLYEGLREGLCDIAEGFSTDGRISAWSFRNLDDTLSFFPAYNASPIVRGDIISEYPEIAITLNQLSVLLDNDTIAALNARVDIGADGERSSGDEESVEEVAASFLEDALAVVAGLDQPITIEEAETAETEADQADDPVTDNQNADEESATDDATADNTVSEDTEAVSAVSEADGDSTEAGDNAESNVDSGAEAEEAEAEEIDAEGVDAEEATSTDNAAEEDTTSENQADKDGDGEDASAISSASRSPGSTAEEDLPQANDDSEENGDPEADESAEAATVQTAEDGADAEDRESGAGDTSDVTLDGELGRNFIVASTSEPTQILLGHMVALFLEDLGIPVSQEMDRGSSKELRSALVDEEIDLYVDYALDSLTTVHRLPLSALPTETEDVLELVNELEESDGLIWFTPLEIGEEFPSATVTRQEVLTAAPGLTDYMEQLREATTATVMEELVEQIERGPDGVRNSGDELSTSSAAQAILCDLELIAACEASQAAAPQAGDDSGATESSSQNSTSVAQPTEVGPLSELRLVLLPTATPSEGNSSPDSVSETDAIATTAVAMAPTSVATAQSRLTLTPTTQVSPTPTSTSQGLPTDTPTPSSTPTQAATLTATPTVSQRIVIQPGPYITVPADYRVNARATTNTEAPVVSVLERANVYRVLGRSLDGEWIQVEVDSESAWVFTNAVFYSAGMLENLPVVTAPSLQSVSP